MGKRDVYQRGKGLKSGAGGMQQESSKDWMMINAAFVKLPHP
jgi:hypothetical protein